MYCPRCQSNQFSRAKRYVQPDGREKDGTGFWWSIGAVAFFGLCLVSVGVGCFQQKNQGDTGALLVGLALLAIMPILLGRLSKLPVSFSFACAQCGCTWSGRKLVGKELAADREAALALASGFERILAQRTHPLIASQELAMARYLRVGEVSRHFDLETSGSIDGWLNHSFGFHGWFLGSRVGGIGLGLGKFGLEGLSQAHLTLSSTSRTDLFSDAFMAVLERDIPGAIVDTFRLVVPSEKASREIIQGLLTDIANSWDFGTPRYQVLLKYAPVIAGHIETNVSYVADRMTALLRQPATERSLVTATGLLVKDHLLIGGEIEFAAERKAYDLFPLGLLQEIRSVLEAAEDRRTQVLETPDKMRINVKRE